MCRPSRGDALRIKQLRTPKWFVSFCIKVRGGDVLLNELAQRTLTKFGKMVVYINLKYRYFGRH